MAYMFDTYVFTIPDEIIKSVTVRPNGVFKTTNEQHLIDVTPASGVVSKYIAIVKPSNMVEDSRSTKIIFTGNFLVPTIDGLDNLIRMPCGCGEQIMLDFALAIFIHDYLEIVGKLTPEIEIKSTKVLKTGLQRELNYQRSDGSFSAFGNQDSSGSSWLTAFVLKCFGQAKGLIQIDNAILSKAMDWLLKYQNSSDGSFREPGRGGFSSEIRMTAFILISLLENRNVSAVQDKTLTMAINKASTYLEAKLYYVKDSFTLSIFCYALASTNSSSRSKCYRKLKAAAIYDDDKVYWKAHNRVSKREVGDRSLRNKAPPVDVETSSYALLTYMKLGYYDEAFPIVKWLVTQRNPTGGQRSTQDTVISIQAIAEYASYGQSAPGPNHGVEFKISNDGNLSHTYLTSSSAFDFLHEIGCQAMLKKSCFKCLDQDQQLSIWTRNDESGMLLMEVEMPTGFQSYAYILDSQTFIKKHETNGRNIALYFNGVNPDTKLCVNVKMDRVDPVVKIQACHVKAYDYYDPVHQAITRYDFGLLKEPNICNICPLCGFCMNNQNGEPIGIGR